MSPMNDFCFKELMQNEKVRQGFLAAILGEKPERIAHTILLPTETRRAYIDDKLAILDVRVCLVDGTQIDLEMQVEYFESWDKRTLFYLSKMYTDQLKKGESYDTLKKCIHVGVLNFIHFPEAEEGYHIVSFYNEKTGKKYTDLLELHILELPKLPALLEAMKRGKGKTDVDIIHWMQFFRGKTKGEFETMAKENEYVEEAVNRLFELSGDEKKRIEYEQREKAIRDYHSQMESAERRGAQRGLEEGRALGLEEGIVCGKTQGRELHLKELVKKKLLKNLSAQEIAEMLEEPIDRIEEIVEEVKR